MINLSGTSLLFFIPTYLIAYVSKCITQLCTLPIYRLSVPEQLHAPSV